MKDLFLYSKSSTRGGDPESDEPYSRCTPEYITTEFLGLTREKDPKGRWEIVEVTEEDFQAARLNLVIVRYSSGGTFQITYGYHEVMGVFPEGKEAEALALADSIQNGTYAKINKGKWLPWTGVFCSLIDVEVHSFPVMETLARAKIHRH